MNLVSAHRGRVMCQLGATLGLVWLTSGLVAQTPTPATNASARPVAERFLLIVDTSAAMQKRSANVERVVGNLFADGIGGQLHRGDTIGVWTYTDALHAGQFPLQRWTPQTSTAIAKNIVEFLRVRKYEKTSRLAPVMAQLTNVVADSDKITILLVSDGEQVLTGTPYDAQIATTYRNRAADQRKQKMPFVTVLRAVKGKFTGFTVNTPPWPVEFPSFPPEPKPVVEVPAPKAKPEAKPAPPPEVKPEPRPVPKVEVTPEPQIASPPVLPATNPLPVTNAQPVPSVSVPEITPPVRAIAVDTSPPPASPPALSNPPPGLAVRLATPKADPGVQPAGVIPSAETRSFPLLLLGAGLVLLLGIVAGVFFWQLRARSKPRASLITRSIDRDPN